LSAINRCNLHRKKTGGMTAEVTASRAASAPLPEMLAWKARRSVSECEKNVGGEGDLLLAGDYAPFASPGP